MLLKFYSFELAGKGEKENSQCDDSEANQPGLLTQQKIITPRNSQGNLVGVFSDYTSSSSDSSSDSCSSNNDSDKEEEHDLKENNQHFSKDNHDTGESMFVHLMQFVILYQKFHLFVFHNIF